MNTLIEFNRVEVITKQLNYHKIQLTTFGRENELAHDLMIGSGFTNFCRLFFTVAENH